MDVDDEGSVAPCSELSRLPSGTDTWLLEKDAPLRLPLRPTPSGYTYGASSRSVSRAASRAASRATSRAARSPLPRPRSALPGPLSEGEGEEDGFPPNSVAATLFHSPGLIGAPGASTDAEVQPAPEPLFFFQLPTSLPFRPGPPLEAGGTADAGRVMTGPEYLATLANSGGGGSGPPGASGGTGSSSQLPVKAEAGPSTSTASAADGAAPCDPPPNDLQSLGSAQIGELVIRRSGKVGLRIGGLTLDVQAGTVCSMDQEIVRMGAPQGPAGSRVDLHRLGKLQERFVVTPNIDDLLGLGRRTSGA